MSGEEAEESVAVGLSPELVDWLDAQAGDDRDREAVLREMVTAYRRISENSGDLGDGTDPADLERRLESQREEYVDLVEDVRERVIQVKREADARAHADHGHPDLESSVEDAVDRVADAEAALADLESAVEDLRADLESGFENYEDVLRYLTDLAEETDDHLDALARAVVDLRETTGSVAAAENAREGADRLKLAANREGITEADCEECGATVALGLLSRPECPHCASAFVDVEPKDGIFGSNTLVTGAAPALEGNVGVESDDLTGLVEDDDAPPVDLTPEEDEDT